MAPCSAFLFTGNNRHSLVNAGDEGQSFIMLHTDSPTGRAVDSGMENLIRIIET